MNNQFLLNQTAKMLGVRGYQIAYAITQGYLPEPKQRLNHQRIFTPADIDLIRRYFANKSNKGRPPRKEVVQ